MKQLFAFLDAGKLNDVTGRVMNRLRPEKIYLLSVVHCRKAAENIFLAAHEPEHTIASVLLLALLPDGGTKAPETLQELPGYGRSPDIILLVLAESLFLQWLKGRHIFARRIYRKAPVLYDSGSTPLPVPDDWGETAAEKALKHAGHVYSLKTTTFLLEADECLAQHQYDRAALLLQKAAVQICTGIIWSLTGLKLQNASPARLYRCMQHILQAIQYSIPEDEALNELFQWLEKAGTGNACNNHAALHYPPLASLSAHIQKLLELWKSIPLLQHSHT